MSIQHTYQCHSQEEYEQKMKEYFNGLCEAEDLRKQGYQVYVHLELPLPPENPPYEK